MSNHASPTRLFHHGSDTADVRSCCVGGILLSAIAIACCCVPGDLRAQGPLVRFQQADSPGVTAFRGDDRVVLEIEATVPGAVHIPRLAAPWRSAHWEIDEAADASQGKIQVHPEPDHWVVRWSDRPKQAKRLVIELDAAPRLLAELEPVAPVADGSLLLPAHLARVWGEKLRYEPQPFKNTVGYWVIPTDRAEWSFTLDRPGKFNVAILQGCGVGQGGSRAAMEFRRLTTAPDDRASDVAGTETGSPQTIGRAPGNAVDQGRVRFEVRETGHFQNFQWRHLGTVELQVGTYVLVLHPEQIAKNALMDVRAIHLVRLPDAIPRR